MQSDIVLSSRVRLARNYADLPFDLASEPEQAETCILRTLSALRQAGLEEQYDLLRLRDMSDVSRRAMEESHLVSRDQPGNCRRAGQARQQRQHHDE